LKDVVEFGVVDCVEGRDEINVENKDVFVVEVGIFNGIDQVSELPMAVFVQPEALLCGGEDVVPFNEEVNSSTNVACP